MKLSRPKRIAIIITSVVVLALVIAVVIINFYVGSLIEGKIREALKKSDTNFEVSIRNVKFNIISGNIKILDLKIQPDSSLLESIKKGEAHIGSVQGAEVPLFKIAGINLYKAIVDGYINLRKIELRQAHITFYRGIKPKQEIKQKGNKKTFRTDSIYLKDLNGVDLKRIVFKRCKVDVYDLVDEKFIMQSGEINLELTDLDLIEKPEKIDVFRMGFDHFKLELSIDEFKLPGGWYNLSVKHLRFDMVDSSIRIKGLKYWPQYIDLDKMARDLKFTKEIFDLDIKQIDIYQLNAGRMVNQGEVYIDSILVNGMSLNLLKDKRYPFNETLRPKLPQQLLKTMKLPLDIGKIKVEQSYLRYQQKMPDQKELLTVTLNKIKASISGISSVKDSIKKGEVLKIRLNAKLMDKANMDIRFVMFLNSRSDTMFYSGSLGSSMFKPFNQALVPALGIEVKAGKLNSIAFNGSANSHFSKGKMTMKYEGLVAEVFKKESKDKNKFMTWVANSAVHKNNPGKKGKLRVAHIEFERVMYKGFGNFMWKSVQSGLVNTISPTGKHEKVEKVDGKESKEELKKEKVKKKEQKKEKPK